MHKNNTICACSGGQIRIHTPVEKYYLSPIEIRSLLVFGNEVPLHQVDRLIDPDAVVFVHRGGKGIVISTPDNAWLVPRDAFELIARGAISEARMQPIPRECVFS